MSTKTTAKKATGADFEKSAKSQKSATKAQDDVTGEISNSVIENVDEQSNASSAEKTLGSSSSNPSAAAKSKTKSEKKVSSTKAATKKASNNKPSLGSKKIRLAASCYHYYRNWLKEYLRSHGAPSARFQKAPESYDGHITVAESEKAKGLKALEQWKKENPETKEMFWDVKK